MALVSVQVPATSANLGPGFDALGLALDLVNSVQAVPAERTEIAVRGEGAASLATGEQNLVYRAVVRAFEAAGRRAPALRLECENRIPLARGLGSSAAATVAGLLLGNALLDRRLGDEELLRLATEMEGHPDNVAPCLFGGIQVCVSLDSGQVVRCPVPVPRQLSAVILIPAFPMDTQAARAALPSSVPLKTAVHNVGRTALLVAALATERLELLKVATQDALHQPPRSAIFPALPALLDAALDAGALGAFLSGAGSSVCALVAGAEARVEAALAARARELDLDARVVRASLSRTGAQVQVAE